MWFEMLRIQRAWSPLLVFAASLSGACGSPDDGSPFAVPVVSVDRSNVPLGGRLEMAYQFTVLPQIEGLTERPRVRVHFLDPEGEILFTDDHDPPPPTTAWRPGGTITYQRRVYIPLRPYVGPTSVTLGLYSAATGERLPLAGEQIGASGYLAAIIDLVPPHRSSSPTFQSGWHQREHASGRGWRWSTGEGVRAFLNPRRGSMLYVEVVGRPHLFESPQRLDFVIGGRTVDSLLLETADPTFHTVMLKVGDLGDADTTELTLRVDQTFVPAEVPGTDSTDERRLGVLVSYAYLETT